MVGHNFGRRIEFDPRSRGFAARALVAQDAARRTWRWQCPILLDQGSTSACTGFSVAYEASARPVVVPGINNDVAQAIYHRAKQLDQWEGEDYEGSSVLAAIKAGAERGWYPQYRWAFGEEDLALSIGYLGPAVLGMHWYTGMCEPNAAGFVRISGVVEGDHAICCVGYNAVTKCYCLRQSWGAWGHNGNCFIHQDDVARLLSEKGEACIPVLRAKGT
jgi:hypothetical protein